MPNPFDDNHRRPTGRHAVASCGLVIVCAAMGLRVLSARLPLDVPLAPPPVDRAEQTITLKELRTALTYLAADARAGRGVGHEGNDAAVRYLVERMAATGVTAPASGFAQPVPLVTSRLGRKTRLAVADSAAPPRWREWRAGDEFFPVPTSAVGTVEGDIVYAGAGIVDADGPLDDYGSLDVRDRIVVVLDQGRPRRPLPVAIGESRLAEDPGFVEVKTRRAAARGAVALVVVSRDRRLHGFTNAWPRDPSIRDATYRLAEDVSPIPVVRISASVASELLRLGETDSPARDVNSLFNNPSYRFTATNRVRLTVDTSSRAVAAPNVIGFVPGRDPVLQSEVVVVSAHLDHDGIDAAGRIYNGADDDGSGTVAVLEVAGAFAEAVRQGGATRRGVVLALFNAEERGLLGSRYFAAHPLPASHRPVANLNLDMVGRHEDIPRTSDPRFRGLRPRPAAEAKSGFHILGYTLSPDLARIVEAEADRVGLSARQEYDDNSSNLLRRSDHWSFLSAGVPALFLTTGLHPEYHTPLDDVDDIDFENLERMARLTFRAAWRIADAAGDIRLAAPPTSEP
ncbi:MAG: M28 family peptidase [Vicinamibacterales bacterium]